MHTHTHTQRLTRPQECHSRDSLIHHRCSYTNRHVQTDTLTHGAHTEHTHTYAHTCTHVCHWSSFSYHSHPYSVAHWYRGYYRVIGQHVGRGLWVLNDCQVRHSTEGFIFSLNLLISCQESSHPSWSTPRKNGILKLGEVDEPQLAFFCDAQVRKMYGFSNLYYWK